MAEAINPSIFRAYDIRGLVDVDLTEQTMHTLGQAAGTFFRRHGGQVLVVGRDVRPSSPRFQAALSAGLQQAGIDVIDIGEVATPVMYFAVEHLRAAGGIVVSASHNPPAYNGVKLRRANATYGSEPLTSADIAEVGRIAQSGQFASGSGTTQQADVADAYVQSITRLLRLAERPRIVLDGGNGVAGPLALRTFEAIGAAVVPLYIEPDGTFPNHHPDPLKAENLRDLIAAVRDHEATLGIALDGDGDRLGVVDGAGTIVWADRYLIVLARDMLARRAGAVVFDVKCSTVLIEAIRAAGGTPVMGKTGYPNMSARMRETDAVLGGELSGHTMLPYPGHYFDDGTFAGIHLLASLERLADGGPPRTLAAALEPYPVLPVLPEQRIPFDDTAKFAVVDAVRERFAPHYTVIDVDGVRIDFGDGWGLIRPSNTEPAITTRFEAVSEDRLYAIRDMMLDVVEEVRASQHL
jgi:phosphomannomutase